MLLLLPNSQSEIWIFFLYVNIRELDGAAAQLEVWNRRKRKITQRRIFVSSECKLWNSLIFLTAIYSGFFATFLCCALVTRVMEVAGNRCVFMRMFNRMFSKFPIPSHYELTQEMKYTYFDIFIIPSLLIQEQRKCGDASSNSFFFEMTMMKTKMKRG